MLLLLMAVPLTASTVLKVNFAHLSQTAHHVVAGRITDVTASKDPASGYIYSQVTIAVSQAEPAALVGRQYSFRMIGGELNGKRLHIAGFPQFKVDDKVVLFLNSQPSTVFGPTVGLWQGVFFLKDDPAGGVERVIDHQRRPVLAIQDQNLVRGVARKVDASGTELTVGGEGPASLKVTEFFEAVRAHRARPVTAPPAR